MSLCIEYCNEAGRWALDWNFKYKDQWSMSFLEFGATCWEFYRGITKIGYSELLKHFGLLQWSEEFPLGVILTMSPAALTLERRSREKKYAIMRMDIKLYDTVFHTYIDAEKIGEL